MPIDPNDFDQRAIKSMKSGDESVTMRSAADMQGINELEGIKAAACDPAVVYNFLNAFNLNVTVKNFPQFDPLD